MGIPPTASPSTPSTWQTANPLTALDYRCDFLRVTKEVLAHQLPAVANSLLPFSALALAGLVASPLHRTAGGQRERQGRHRHASAAIVDAQSIKTVEESASISGFDAHKHVKGRKRHLLVDTLGLPLSIYVTPADLPDAQGARRLLAGLKYFVPRLKKIWADAAYRGQELANWCKERGDWDLEVVERIPGTRGFRIQPNRWVVERAFGWLSRSRRLSKDYERKVQTSETLIEVAMIRLLVARLSHSISPMLTSDLR